MWIVIAIVVVFLLVLASKSLAGSGNGVDAWNAKRCGETTEPPIDVDSVLFQTSAMKAREFLAETTAARSSFVDNRQVEEWKNRYAAAFAALKRCTGTQHEQDLRRASETFGDLRQSVGRFWGQALAFP